MKHIFLAVALLLITALSASAQGGASPIYWIGTARDTAKPNTTKVQAATIRSTKSGLTVQYHLQTITDTTTGYVSVWASIDDSTYCPYPGADSVAITAHADLYKLWFLNTIINGNPIRALQVRTRCVSNTTNATGKAKVTTKMFPYN